jgi:hypothetical protein
MRSNLEEQPYSEVMDMLESLADKHKLLLSDNLINFADDVWELATKAERQAHALAKDNEDSNDTWNKAWTEWVNINQVVRGL